MKETILEFKPEKHMTRIVADSWSWHVPHQTALGWLIQILRVLKYKETASLATCYLILPGERYRLKYEHPGTLELLEVFQGGERARWKRPCPLDFKTIQKRAAIVLALAQDRVAECTEALDRITDDCPTEGGRP